MGFTRRFATRVGDDSHPLQEGGEHHEEIPTLSARIEEKQKRVDTRPCQNNKIYPKTDDLEPGVAEERQRQSNLQKKICIFLCTVLPLVTTGATLHRLWFTGLLSFKDRSDEQDCPHGWTNWSSSCYRHINSSLSWSSALATCSALGSNLVDVQSKAENSFISNMTGSTDFWSGGILEAESSSWQWDGGAPWTWSGWTSAEAPSPGVRGCLLVKQGGTWATEDCSRSNSALCEIKLELEISTDSVTDTDSRPPSTSGPSGPCYH